METTVVSATFVIKRLCVMPIWNPHNIAPIIISRVFVAKAKKKPDPVEESDEEPVVRKEEKKPNAVPAKKSNLAAMVDDWDENE